MAGGSFGAGFGDIGSAVSDIFGAMGAQQEGQAFGQAAQLAGENAQIAKSSEEVQLAQSQRKAYQAESGVGAGAGAGGFQLSGSSAGILRMNAEQGALSKQLVQAQGQININSYTAQQQAYLGQQQAAELSAKAQAGGGLLSAAGAIFNFL